MKVLNLKKVLSSIKSQKTKYNKSTKMPSVIVGYTARYALHVHENLGQTLKGQPRPSPKTGNYWDPNGQPKFLEQPARTLAGELATIVKTAMKNGATMLQSLFIAGLRLQRESQLLVPVDTSNLKNSAFTKKE